MSIHNGEENVLLSKKSLKIPKG